MDVIKTQQISARPIEKVIVHPLVLLSIVDNYNRVAKDTRKRVVGVLLGSSFKGTVDVTNSYAGSYISVRLLVHLLLFRFLGSVWISFLFYFWNMFILSGDEFFPFWSDYGGFDFEFCSNCGG